MQGIRWS